MSEPINVRPIQEGDFVAWLPLWDGYNAFYGRKGETALRPEITQTTWQRFLNPNEPVFALVAESAGTMLGIAHYLFHRSTSRIEQICYLQDLFTAPEARGRGIGKALIHAVYQNAKETGSSRVYWQTHETNVAGRLLYDKIAKHVGFIVYTKEL